MPIHFVPKVTGSLGWSDVDLVCCSRPTRHTSSLLAELKTNESVVDIWQTASVSSRWWFVDPES